MAAEDIYNVFLLMENDVCCVARYVVHQLDFATDEEASDYLRSHVESDFAASIEFPLSRSFTRSEYYAQIRIGWGMSVYEDLLAALGASEAPLCVTTLVLDGQIKVNYSAVHGDPDIYLNPTVIGDAKMDDWLLKYTNERGIDLPRLIHDDYFVAIKLTFQSRLFVSAMKLLMSCLDSISYIEYGDDGSVTFSKWLDEYADLSGLGVTSAELWEMRNGLLHMTNLHSRQVRKQNVRRISFQIGGTASEVDEIFYFVFQDLINVYADALGRWLESYNVNREKFAKFVERYDETISDSRFMSRPNGDVVA